MFTRIVLQHPLPGLTYKFLAGFSGGNRMCKQAGPERSTIWLHQNKLALSAAATR